MGGLLAFVRSVTATHCFVQANGRTLWMLSQWCCVLSSSSSCGSVEERDGGLSLSLCVCEYVWTEWSLLCCVVSCLFRLGFSSTPNRPCGARCCRCRSLRLYFLIGRLDCSVPSCFFFPFQGPPPPSINQSIKNQKRAREPTSTKDDLMARQSRSNLDTMTLICLCSSRQLVISSVVRTLKRTRIRNFVC